MHYLIGHIEGEREREGVVRMMYHEYSWRIEAYPG